MSSLEVVAVPSFGKQDGEWLVRIRQARAHNAGPPRFTLVFPGSKLESHDFSKEVSAVVTGIKRIRFCLRSAMVVPDRQVSSYHVFLVPDEGFGALIRLHARLHAGALAECLRPEVPYIPHLTVGSVRDLAAAQELAASLNAKELAISGRIEELEIHRRDGEVVRCIRKVALAKGGLFG